eukprot:TRINITY_DN5729_c0_g1_i1.p1 TRINITY_DN5729_c0_g1~~TRINITY_DN5729_c0_g1_i1.p1  ORF type:complete len:448 (-),score=98.34 TRINITY_DN5729_c0_g1_i1:311-1654(-)
MSSATTTNNVQQRVQVINLLPTARRNSRKKMRLACVPCAKSKQGCDALRPCTRCVKKGTPELCLDKEGRVGAEVPVEVATPVNPNLDGATSTGALPAMAVVTDQHQHHQQQQCKTATAIPVPASIVPSMMLPAKRRRASISSGNHDNSLSPPVSKMQKKSAASSSMQTIPISVLEPSFCNSSVSSSIILHKGEEFDDEDDDAGGMLSLGGDHDHHHHHDHFMGDDFLQDELMPLALVSLIPHEPDLRPGFSVYHLLYQQPCSAAYGRICRSVIENISPMVMEDFIVRSGKWVPFWKIYESAILDEVVLDIQNKMISAALDVSGEPDKILTIVSSQSFDENLNQLMTRNYSQGIIQVCSVVDLTVEEKESLSSAFGIATADIESADIAFTKTGLSVTMTGIVPTMFVNERMTQLMCMSPASLIELVRDLWRIRITPQNMNRKATPLWK